MKAFLPGLLVLLSISLTTSVNGEEKSDPSFNEQVVRSAFGKFEDPGRKVGDEQWQTTLR